MKKLLLNRKKLMQLALTLCLILVSANTSWGQQTIGSFQYINGGFEGYSTGNLAVTTSGSSNAWTIQTTVTTLPKIVTSTTNGSARTGSNFVAVANSTTSANRVLQSPTTTGTAPAAATAYTIQYYYRNSTVAGFGVGVGNGGGYTTVAGMTIGDGTWLRKAVSYTPSAISSNFLVLGRLNATYTAEFDDIVVYAGAEDTTAPTVGSSAIVSAITSSQQTINWTAGSDTEGAVGYMVVRSTIADPASTPNQGGIYSVGNTVATDEQVVYMGNGTNFTDLGLAQNTTYYYRIYTVDKAFNYSATGLSFNSTTTAPIVSATEPTIQASGLTLGNVTGSTLDISWTAGNGSNSLVLVKATSAVDTDPTDGGIYTSNLAFGFGTQIGTGNYAVYNGTGNSATITGLTRGSTYYVKVYTFNVNAAGSENYLTTSPANGSILNLPYQNTFTFDSTTDGFATLTRAVAIQVTESSIGTLKINSTGANRNSSIVGLNTSYARVDVTTNKYAHITLKNMTTNNNIQLVCGSTNLNPRQIITTSDANYKTYDFDLSALTGDQYPTINISVKDTWSGTATYAVDDTVIQSNGTYKNRTGVNTATVPRLDATNWQLEGTEGGLLDFTNFIYIDSIVFDNVLPTLVSNGTGGGNWSAGTTWAGGIVPGTNDNVNIVGSDAVNSTGTRNCNQLSITSGSSLTVAGGSLTVKNGIINNGTITIENNANLIQVNNVANTGSGTAIVKRNSASIQLYDYTLWSSPVAGQNLRTFSNNTLANRFYTYNSTTNQYNAVDFSSPVNFAPATGYLIRAPNTWAPATPDTFNGVFTGILNNGNQGLSSLIPNQFYATGNPYPSTISAEAFYTENASAGTLYFWRRTNGNISTTAYATLNRAGSTTTSFGLTPSADIAVGQGFIVSPGATTLSFKNAMRSSNTSATFLRTIENRSRFWLNLTSITGAFCQTMVAYMPEATSGVDNAIDGRYFNDSPIALTSIINNEEYTIQGRAMPFSTSDSVPLGFKTDAAGNYTIAIDHVDGLFSTGQAIYLKDNLLNTVNNLSAGSYSFASAIGTFNSRFELVYQSTLAETNPTFTANSVIAFNDNGDIRINSGSTIMELVRVYDLLGRLLVEKKQINSSETKLSTTAINQVLLIEITAANGTKVTKKIIQ
ncbi:CHU large protein [Flavobacteria bacterium BAL38]|nr:CHU large protein [Flavobacteria bacterium BAL38]